MPKIQFQATEELALKLKRYCADKPGRNIKTVCTEALLKYLGLKPRDVGMEGK